MRTLPSSLIAAAFIAVGCAASNPAIHPADPDAQDTLALTGVIVRHSNVAATYRTPKPGMGAIAAAIVAKIPEKRAYTVYIVKGEDGRERVVSSTQEFKDGDCIEVFASQDKVNAPSWDQEDLTLKPSTACVKRDL